MQNILNYGDNLVFLLIAGSVFLVLVILFHRWQVRTARSLSVSQWPAPASPAPISAKESYLASLRDTKRDHYRREATFGRGLNFDKDNLEGFDFKYTHLESCSFENAYLKNADFTDGCITDVTFRHAILFGAKLTNARLTRVNFENAALDQADLSQVSLTDTDLTRAQLLEADLRGASLPEKIERARFSKADLRFTDFHPSARVRQDCLQGARYNFFTNWPANNPFKILEPWPASTRILPLPAYRVPLHVNLHPELISADGLGPNPVFVHPTLWPKCQLTRWETLKQAAVRFGVDIELRAHIQSTTKARFDKLIATSESIGVFEILDRWINPSVDDLYVIVAYWYRRYKFIFKDVLETRPDIVELIQEYYVAALDLLTLAEYTKGAFLRDDFLHVLADDPQKPEFESPIEELFWDEWQKQGGASTVKLQYQYTVPDTNYRIDFVHLSKKLAVELDGYEYHNSKERFTADRKRQRELESRGWRFIRFSGSEVVRDVGACFKEVCVFVDSAS